MDKLTMAHEYFMKHGRNNSWMESDVIDAWKYADAMQAEADKRNYSEKQDGSDWQPDWSQAPEWANWWAICSRGQACWYGGEPERSKAWWILKHDSYPFHTTTSFNYQGNWKDSLRKRPQ